MPQIAQAVPGFYLSYDEYEGQRLPEEVPGSEIWLLIDPQTSVPTIIEGRATQTLTRSAPRLKGKQWRLKFKRRVSYPWDVRLFSGPWSPQFRLAITATLLDPALYYERLDRQYKDKWPEYDEVSRILKKPLSKAVKTAFSLEKPSGSQSVAPLTVQYVSKLQRGVDLTPYLQGLREASIFHEYGMQVQVTLQGLSTLNSLGESVLDPQRGSLQDYEHVIAIVAATLESDLRQAKKWLQQHVGGQHSGESELGYRERLYTQAAAYYTEYEPLIASTILEIVGTNSYLWEEGARLAATIFKDVIRQQFATVTRPIYPQTSSSGPTATAQPQFSSSPFATRAAQIGELYEFAAREKWKLSPPREHLFEDLSIEVENEGLTLAVRVPSEYPKAPLFIQMMEGRDKARRSQREVNELIDMFSDRDTICSQIRGLVEGTIQRRMVASTQTQPIFPSPSGVDGRSLELLRQQKAPTIPADIYWQQQAANHPQYWDNPPPPRGRSVQKAIQGPPATYPASEIIQMGDSDLADYYQPVPSHPAADPSQQPQALLDEQSTPAPDQNPQPGSVSDMPTKRLSPSRRALPQPEQQDAIEEASVSQQLSAQNIPPTRQIPAQDPKPPLHPSRKVVAQPAGTARLRSQIARNRQATMRQATYQKRTQEDVPALESRGTPRTQQAAPSPKPEKTNVELPTTPVPAPMHHRLEKHGTTPESDASQVSMAPQHPPAPQAPSLQASNDSRLEQKKKPLRERLPKWSRGKHN